MNTLRRVGPCNVYALAKASERNYSNVHTDISRLKTLGLVQRAEDGSVVVPYESVEILLPFARGAQAMPNPSLKLSANGVAYSPASLPLTWLLTWSWQADGNA